MSQELILKKLAAFLDQVDAGKQKPRQAALRATFLELLKKDINGHGFCFGFSVCHAAMDLVGKLNWWEAALIAIANWDGKQNPEKILLDLPGSRTAGKPVTLAAIMERVLNYVVMNHASITDKSYENFKLKEVQQKVFLKSVEKKSEEIKDVKEEKKSSAPSSMTYFEILDEKDQVRKIQDKTRLTGRMSDAQLEEFLDEKMIEGNIVLASTFGHTVRIGYRDSKWFIYDPNAKHDLKASSEEKDQKVENPQIYKSFDSKKEMIEALTKELGNSLDIEIATLNPKQKLSFPKFEALLKTEKAGDLFQEEGLALLGEFAPEYVDKILQAAPHAYDAIASGFTQRGYGKSMPSLHRILFLDDDSPVIRQFEKFVKMAAESKDFSNNLAMSLADRDTKNRSGLYMVLECYKNFLPLLLNEAEKADVWPRQAAVALQTRDNEDFDTGLHMLSKHAPSSVVVRVIEASGQAENGAAALLSCLCAENKAGKTGRHAINKFSSKDRKKIENAIARAFAASLKQLDKQTVAKISIDLESALTDPKSPYRNLCKKQHFTLFKSHSETTIWQSLTKAAADRMVELNKEAKDEKKYTPPESLSL